ncbi:MAG TPA: hypothetical protein VIL37_18045 [Natronosporangium sp.]
MTAGKPGVPRWAGTAGDSVPSAGPTGPDEWAAAGHIGRSSRAQATLSRLLAYLLWATIAVALVLSLVNCAGGNPAAAPPVTAPTQSPAPIPPPGGCAELVVSAWLAGDTAALGEVAGMPRTAPEPGRRQATRIYTASVTQGNGGWAYLIGAEVQSLDENDRWRPAGLQFFTVTMVPTAGGCQGWGPAALPAQVAAPALAADEANLGYEVRLATSGTDLATTLEAFFAGLLTGAENLDRYVAPGVSIPPVVPPPYESVEVVDLRAREDPTERDTVVPPDGTLLQVLATVATGTANDAAAEYLPLVYPVTVAVRGGRWEVVAIDPLVGTATTSEGTNGG